MSLGQPRSISAMILDRASALLVRLALELVFWRLMHEAEMNVETVCGENGGPFVTECKPQAYLSCFPLTFTSNMASW